MPLSSSEIAQMNGAYQQQSMSNQQYSGMIGQGYGSYGGGQGTGQRGDAMMGGMMNRGSAYGAPLLAGAAGLMGLDPMSMGMKVGMGAFAGGAGFGGAALAGTGVALPLMALGAAGKYAGSQMYAGAQNQMELNNTLRQSFTFQNRTGGQGFSRGDMSGVGEMMHGMAQQMGPGGELTSMRELTSLAGKMGTMGFAQGVRDVQDFTKRFKEMTTALKSMAKDLGTTMEGAMEFAAASKGSGIFGMSNMSKFSHQVRGATVGGNLGVSEVTGMANIGSQIARSVGGLGRQGAGAGIRTIGQIGAAQQMGLLSEEDIYNQTGLTGAEGRQAMATSALSKSASFLQSGKGRRMLASIAGKDGTLDEAGIQQLMSGGMTISETMKNDKTNLGKIGRANFIRNEGRLRGAAMERLGGFLPAMQLQEWAQGKGIDINNMDDRSMLFAQRQLGMGRDEVDNAVKMANNMPMILEQMRRSEGMDSYFQKQSQQRKTHGLEGVKGRFEHAKQLINGKLEKAGADIFNQGSDTVDRFFNQLLGDYVETYSKDIDDTNAAILSGGASGRSAAKRGYGLGTKSTGAVGVGGRHAVSSQPNRGSMGGYADSWVSDLRGSLGMSGGTQGETIKYMLYGQSDAGKLKDAGFDTKGLNAAGMSRKLLEIQDMQRAAATGFDPKAVAYGTENKSWIGRAYAMDRVTGSGDARIESFGKVLREKDPSKAKEFDAMLPTQKAEFMANVERANGVGGNKALTANLGLPETGGLRSGYESEEAENQAYSRALGGVRHSLAEKLLGGAMGGAAFMGALGVASLGGPAGLAAALRGKDGGFSIRGSAADRAGQSGNELASRWFGSYQKDQDLGKFAKSEKYRDLASGLSSTDKSEREATTAQIEKELNSGKEMDDGTKEGLKGLLASQAYSEAAAAHGGKLSPQQEEDLAKEQNMTVDQMKKHLAGRDQVNYSNWKRDLAEGSRRMRESGSKDMDKLSALGIYDAANGELSKASAEKLSKIKGGDVAQAYVKDSLNIARAQSMLGGTENSAERDADLMSRINEASQHRAENLSGMTAEGKKAAEGLLVGTEAGAAAAYSRSTNDKFNQKMHRKGATRASVVNDMLGGGLSKEELASGDMEQLLADKLGIKDKGLKAELHRALKGDDKGSNIADTINRISGSKEVRDTKKKQDDASAEAADPLSAAIKKNGEKTNELLKLIALHSGVTSDALQRIGQSNPDGVGSGTAGTNGGTGSVRETGHRK